MREHRDTSGNTEHAVPLAIMWLVQEGRLLTGAADAGTIHAVSVPALPLLVSVWVVAEGSAGGRRG